jgi:predicted NUDIX family NTP pyrophosphohydrolase
MSKQSAGLLLYRIENELQVLLVHPGGPFFRNKDEGAWTIPKGEIQPGEDPLEAARREFQEETGACPDGPLLGLQPIKQKGGKIVHAWAIRGNLDPAAIVSNTFRLEWPPKSGRITEFPEVDRAQWFTLDQARQKINAAQIPLLDELQQKLLGETRT